MIDHGLKPWDMQHFTAVELVALRREQQRRARQEQQQQHF